MLAYGIAIVSFCNTNDKRRIIHLMRSKEYSYRQYRLLLSKTMVFASAVDCCRALKYLHTNARDPFTIFASKSETTHSLLIITFSSLDIAEVLTLLLNFRIAILGYLRSAASWTQDAFSWILDQYIRQMELYETFAS